MPLPDELQRELSSLLGERFTTASAIREHHGQGEAYPGVYPPDGVVFPETTDEVSRVVAACHRHRVPMVAWGAGTSLEGHVSAVRGGITVDLSQMNKLVRLSAEDLDVTVEAGVTRKQLNEELKGTGLAFFIDPGADATIGGMASTRASGTTAVPSRFALCNFITDHRPRSTKCGSTSSWSPAEVLASSLDHLRRCLGELAVSDQLLHQALEFLGLPRLKHRAGGDHWDAHFLPAQAHPMVDAIGRQAIHLRAHVIQRLDDID